MKREHFHNQDGIRDAMIGFTQFARAKGLNVGIQETLDAFCVADDGYLEDKQYFRDGLRSIFCASQEDQAIFDLAFVQYWKTGGSTVKSKTTYKNRTNIVRQGSSSLVMLGEGENDGKEQDTQSTSGANKTERLRKTDFAKVAEIDNAYLEELALRLWRQMSIRLKRRMRSASKGQQVDIRQTLRRNIAHGGEPIELRMRSRKPQKQRLIVLLDVSGSMDKYSYFLLRFIWSLRAHFETVEAFIFSTSLIRITDYLDASNLASTLSVLSAKANNWSSGTKIGACFRDFNSHYAKRTLVGSSTVVVLSDGLDTGDPEQLRVELQQIRRRTRRVLWLNPLKGMEGYEPIQRGMSAALTEVDIFKSAHSLDSLLELEEYLSRI